MPKDSTSPMRAVSNAERRARLGIRHALTPSARVTTPEDAARAVVSLHATEPSSVYLSCWARTHTLSIDDVDHALYQTRTVIRQQSMRETLFVFPRELIPAVWGSVCTRFATTSKKRLVKDLERWGNIPQAEGTTWLQAAEAAVVTHLADGVPRSAAQLRQQVPEVDGYIVQAPEKSWGGKIAIAPRVLAGLHMDGVVARAHNAGPWNVSRPTWTTSAVWWADKLPQPREARQGYAELINRWLGSYGPGTIDDIAWWLGGTKRVVQTALSDIGAVQVALDDGSIGWLRPDDLDVVAEPEPWVALLPLMDPAVMGWRHRRFFLGDHGPQLFDSIGNAGTSIWVDGQVVGAWRQDAEARVHLQLLENVARDTHAALQRAADELTTWLAGQRAYAVAPSPAMRP